MKGMLAATSFEVEAERRREVLAGSMRAAHRRTPAMEGVEREAERPVEVPASHGLAWIALSVLGRAGGRA
jgi:hypothetical protein